MNVRNFSLDFLQPGSASRGVSAPAGGAVPPTDEWTRAVCYYGEPVLRTLQEGGAKTVQELFDKTKTALNVPDLQVDQFLGVVWRMIESRQLTLVRQGQNLAESSVALPITK